MAPPPVVDLIEDIEMKGFLPFFCGSWRVPRGTGFSSRSKIREKYYFCILFLVRKRFLVFFHKQIFYKKTDLSLVSLSGTEKGTHSERNDPHRVSVDERPGSVLRAVQNHRNVLHENPKEPRRDTGVLRMPPPDIARPVGLQREEKD